MNHKDHKLQVLLTGFDNFKLDGELIENPSGKAVKLVIKDKEIIKAECNIALFAEVIPVEYKYIDETIPVLWKQQQPNLSIHVGVSESASGLTLEMQANNAPYSLVDNNMMIPEAGRNPSPGPNPLATDLPIEFISKKFNQNLPYGLLKANTSSDAGKYVCEYTYFTSLSLYEQMNLMKSSLFVHVPRKTTDDDIKNIAKSLVRLIKICVEHLNYKTGLLV